MGKENNLDYDSKLFDEETEKKLKSDFIGRSEIGYHKNIIEGYLMSNGFESSTVPSYVLKRVFGKRFLIVDGYRKTYKNDYLKTNIDIYVIFYRNKMCVAITSTDIDDMIMKKLNIFKRLYLILSDKRFVYSSNDRFTLPYFLSISFVEYLHVINDIKSTKIAVKALKNSMTKLVNFYTDSVRNIVKQYKIKL